MRRLIDDAATVSAWAMDETAIVRLFEIARHERQFTPVALAAARGERLGGAERARVRDGVAVISIDGPLFKRGNLFTAVIGGTSYASAMLDLSAARRDPAVRAILLAIDSPGGEAAGCAELAEAVRAARGSKPIVAYVADVGASAAYWIASACDAIVCGPSAALGSIGVRCSIPDTRARDERAGVRRFEFVSSQSPYKASDPATDDGNARIQARVDALAQVFVEAVADNRDVPIARVLDGFGRGDVLIGAAAVAAGMADRLGTFESVLADLSAGWPIARTARPVAASPLPLTPPAAPTATRAPAMPVPPAVPAPSVPPRPAPSAAELARIEGERVASFILGAVAPPSLVEATPSTADADPAAVMLLDAVRQGVPASSAVRTDEEAAVDLILESYRMAETGARTGGGDDGEAAAAAIMAAWRNTAEQAQF